MNLKTRHSRKCDDLFVRGEEVSLVEGTADLVRVRFVTSGPGSKLFHLVRYFASFERLIWLGCHCRVQAAVSPYYEDLVKFAQLGRKTDGCPVINYRVHFDTRVPEIQVTGGEGWIKLYSVANLPYSVPPGYSFRRFSKHRHDIVSSGGSDPLVPVPPTPPENPPSSGSLGGLQHGPAATSTPSK